MFHVIHARQVFSGYSVAGEKQSATAQVATILTDLQYKNTLQHIEVN
jgi:hypothetical protein